VHKDFEVIMQARLVGAHFEALDEQVLMVPMVYVINFHSTHCYFLQLLRDS